jgi:hypothetical protein
MDWNSTCITDLVQKALREDVGARNLFLANPFLADVRGSAHIIHCKVPAACREPSG